MLHFWKPKVLNKYKKIYISVWYYFYRFNKMSLVSRIYIWLILIVMQYISLVVSSGTFFLFVGGAEALLHSWFHTDAWRGAHVQVEKWHAFFDFSFPKSNAWKRRKSKMLMEKKNWFRNRKKLLQHQHSHFCGKFIGGSRGVPTASRGEMKVFLVD